MKIVVFCSEEKNVPIFQNANKDNYFEIKFVERKLDIDSVEETKGYEGIVINTLCIVTDEVAEKLQQYGVKYIASRAAGTDHLKKEILSKYGLKVANVPSYSPNAISELTIMLLLNLVRNMKALQYNMKEYNFNTDDVCGREIRNMKVGVIGCGNIGMETLRILSGLTEQVFVLKGHLKKENDLLVCQKGREREKVYQYAQYTDLEYIQNNCDAIILHMPYSDENYHVIDKKFIEKCSKRPYLINASRGAVVDAVDILCSLEEGKLSGYGFDVYEGEERFICKQSSKEEYEDGVIEKLCSRTDVEFTPHVGYFTQEAITAMIEISLNNLKSFNETQSCKNQI